MKAEGAIIALSGKIAKNKRSYIVLEMENGEKIWCWEKRKIADFTVGDIVALEASDEQYPRLATIKKITQQEQTELRPSTLPATAPVPAAQPKVASVQAGSNEKITEKSVFSLSPAGAIAMQTDEVLTRVKNIENYLAEFDKKYLELFQGVAENLAQNAATIQTIAGTTAKLSSDVHDFMLEQAEKEAKE